MIDVDGPEIYLTDGRQKAKVRITEVDNSKNFGQLGEREIKGEGFSTKQELEADLRRYYRNLCNDEPVTVIWFQLVSVSSM
jgi:hypothetical protein